MTETPVETTELKAQYSAQVAADLARNTKEQNRLCGEIDALQDQLRTLQQDQVVLVNMQQALGVVTPEPATAVADAAATSVPQQKPTTAPKADNRTRPKKATPSPDSKETKAKAIEKKSATKTAAPKQTAQPTLVELICRHLTGQSEPRSAAEVATALTQAHPDRRIQVNVVRTTLEGLVAKSNAQRTKQGSSVYYTSPDTEQPTTPPQADSEPAQATG